MHAPDIRYSDIQMYLNTQCQRPAANVLSQAVRGFLAIFVFIIICICWHLHTYIYI